jgi:hypothetical protein
MYKWAQWSSETNSAVAQSSLSVYVAMAALLAVAVVAVFLPILLR